MKIKDCTFTDLGNAVAIDIPCQQASDNSLTTFVDPDVYRELLALDASLSVRSRRGKPCIILALPGKPATYLARFVMGSPKRGLHVHHALFRGKACNLINTAEHLQVLTPAQHMACHRAAEADRRKGAGIEQ